MSFELAMLTLYLALGLGVAWMVCSGDMYDTDPMRTTVYAVVLIFIWGLLVPLVLFECLIGGSDDETGV